MLLLLSDVNPQPHHQYVWVLLIVQNNTMYLLELCVHVKCCSVSDRNRVSGFVRWFCHFVPQAIFWCLCGVY